MKLFERLRSIVLDPSRNLRERVFLALTVAVISIVCLALLGDIIYGENIIEIIVLAITLVVSPIISIMGVRTGNVDFAARIISMGVVLVVMPTIFFFGGGLRGGVIPWLVFTYLYIFLILLFI